MGGGFFIMKTVYIEKQRYEKKNYPHFTSKTIFIKIFMGFFHSQYITIAKFKFFI